MTKIHFPHDALFKTLMADHRVAKEFFARHLPNTISAIVNLDSLSLCEQSFVDEKLKSFHIDVLYKVKMRNKEGDLYLLCEQQSTPDLLMPMRLLEYNVAIWRAALKKNRNQKLFPIINMVFYTGSVKYNHSCHFNHLLQLTNNEVKEIWVKPFMLIGLEKISDEELKKYYWSGMMEFFMKNIRKDDFFSYLKQVLSQLQWLRRNNGKYCVNSLLNYAICNINGSHLEIFFDAIKYQLPHLEGEEMATIAEILNERGIKQGLQEGERSLFSWLLNAKFPMEAKRYDIKFKEADPKALRFLSQRLLTAKTIEEVFQNN